METSPDSGPRCVRGLVAVLLVCTAAASGFASTDLPNPGKLDAVLDGYVEGGSHPFLYARIEDDAGRVIYEHGAVNRRLAPEQPLNGDAWMRIWSMTKLVTTVLVLDLVEEGVLKLSDPVVRFIPEFEQLRVATAPDGRSLADVSSKGESTDGEACPHPETPASSVMTVAHLLNHEAGFYYGKTGIACLDTALAKLDLPASRSTDEFIAKLTRLPIIQQPGAGYYYGLNTTVLGFVAERATGRSLKRLVEERISRPFAIEGFGFDLTEGRSLPGRFSGADGTLRLAREGELDLMGPSVPDYDPDRALYFGGEGMIATAAGFLDFLRILLAGGARNGQRLLDQATILDMVSPQAQVNNPFGYMGYALWVNSGLRQDGSQGRGGLWTGGGYEGTQYWIDPDNRLVGVIMTQIHQVPESGHGMVDAFRAEFYRQIGALTAPESADRPEP